jgi:hypothetical protein
MGDLMSRKVSGIPRDLLFWYEFAKVFDVTTPEGKARLETLRRRIGQTLQKLDIQISKGDKVLILMSGTCPEGIVLAMDYGAKPVCVDVREDALKKGAEFAKSLGAELEIITCDLTEIPSCKLGKGYSLAMIWGSSLPHISIWDFDSIAIRLNKILNPGGWLIIEQTDLVFGMYKRYRDVVLESADIPVLSIHSTFSPEDGYFERMLWRLDTNERLFTKMYVWSPWIISYVLLKNGFKDVISIYIHPRHVVAGRAA